MSRARNGPGMPGPYVMECRVIRAVRHLNP